MFYQFPHIQTIDDVLPHIEDCDEIIVADRGDHTTINYVVVTPDTFPPINVAGGSAKMRAQRSLRNAIRRECRGMIFDNATGKILRRPYHKFFNANERDETLFGKIPFDCDHRFLEKLDGSMIAPFMVDEEIYWGTRMGVTDVADQTQSFLQQNVHYIDFAGEHIRAGWTPIFEWCSRQQKIVIDHPEDRLVLTGIRNMFDGTYCELPALQFSGEAFGVEVLKNLPIEAITSAEDIHKMPMEDVGEGTVIRWDNGHMVKIKTEEYCRIHKVKERIEEERHIVLDLVKHEFDDTIAMVPFEDRQRLQKYASQFWKARAEFIDALVEKIHVVPAQFDTRKEFALSDQQGLSKFEIRTIFHYWDIDQFEGKGEITHLDVDKYMVAKYVDETLIIPNCGSRTKFGDMKAQVFPNISFTRI